VKPEVVTKTTRTRSVKITIGADVHQEIIIQYLKRHHGHFRGFLDDDFAIDFAEDGQVLVEAYKEYNT
jgi:hypothetical protein